MSEVKKMNNLDDLDELDFEDDELDFEDELDFDDNSDDEELDFNLDEIDNEKPEDNFESDNIDVVEEEDDFAQLDDISELEDMPEMDELSIDEGHNMLEDLDDTSDYTTGTLVDSSDLLADDDDSDMQAEVYDDSQGFVSGTGDFVIMDNSGSNKAFTLAEVDINDIAITKRVRQNANSDDITRSIKSTGLLMPIVVAATETEGLYVLLDGWRRLMGCARAGKRKVPVIINNNVSTPEIPIIESMYNHSRTYTIKEIVDYIDYLEKEKGIMNPSMIEYLLQMNSGDYTKLKDLLNDNDEDILEKLYAGAFTIDQAFKKLEQRRKKESLDEKENKKAAAVYDDEEESGADQIAGSGEEASAEDGALTDEQIDALSITASELDDGLDDVSLDEMIEEDKNIEGFKPHKQKVGEREYIDPAIKKAVMVRDNGTCQCCKRGGEQYADVLDYHHCLPVFLGGADTVDNGIMLCVACHRMVHLYSTDDLHVDKALLEGSYSDLEDNKKEQYISEAIFEDEKKRLKRIIKLGSVIRKGMAAKGINKDKYKKEHSNASVGRRKPGVNAEQEKS